MSDTETIQAFLHNVLMAHAEDNPEDAGLVDETANRIGIGDKPFSYHEITKREDPMHQVRTPFGRLSVFFGDNEEGQREYMVVDIDTDDMAARVFIDGAECFSPTEGYV